MVALLRVVFIIFVYHEYDFYNKWINMQQAEAE